ncbi:MAG: tRNA preQ1(34) S-adenosylmethionine ribosyltransferase-isomerase QueA [Chthonomonas sp.]|nr:tRNA preQ1(34) S-adenosylmethionine ribosyltransferase-isomerase QueA [Chthonomonas sp.]
MFLSDYDYDLPPELIAQKPLEDRSASRMLVLPKNGGSINDAAFEDLPTYLSAGDVLVLNNTKVSAIRLHGKKSTGALVEALLLRESSLPNSFMALVKPGKRLKVGAEIHFAGDLKATVTGEGLNGERELTFFEPISGLTETLHRFGSVPLPPYITTALEDPDRYQTVFAEHPGSSAAPTASLHFTKRLMEEIAMKGVRIAYVTLSVGIDTFRPVEATNLDDHVMHGETCTIGDATAGLINDRKGRLIAVGTTAVRTIETFADQDGSVQSGTRDTRIFIKPGYQWRAVDGMLTNFHLPRTTMLMMISAMVGREPLMNAYAHAIREHYRFLSFGDAMLVI